MTLLEVATAWRDQDPDDETRAELDALITDAAAGDEDAVADLHDRFDTRLEFGTAGLRGRIEAGSNRMNRVLVAQAAAGLAAFLLARGEHPSIVIGYDGRKNSKVFATDTAELMAGAGVRAIILPRELPTPVLAFAVRQLGVSAGVMVTASHNPPQDNGYKVYLGDDDEGSQIVPPSDGEIAAEILRVAATANVLELPRSPKYETADEEVVDEYVRRTAALATGSPVLRYVYTPLHGVGWETAHRVFRAAGFAEPIIVRQQVEPDAAFPTVAFPNPEEPGAMDLAFALGTAENADLVIANDPDADRLAIGVPAAHGWERLSGNEVGALLGWRAAERLAASDGPGAGVLAASIVSSPALAAVAAHYGLTYADTLTGFKWVSRVPDLSFGYEEALGYLVDPGKIRDKDGISAAVDFLALATELRATGSSLREHRLAFADTFGGFASGQVSIRVSDLAQIRQIMQRLRADLPEAIGETPVSRVDDFADGFEQFPAGDILRFWLADGSRVIVRPSGTEPKVKVYLDASSSDGTADARLAAAQAKVVALEAAMRELLA
ncbi:MAG: phospho-sugar mutase [Lacisediminihabitans sp.]